MKPSPTSIRNDRRPKLEAVTAYPSVSYILNPRGCKSKSNQRLSNEVYQFRDAFGYIIVQSNIRFPFHFTGLFGSFAFAIAVRLKQVSSSLPTITRSGLEPTKPRMRSRRSSLSNRHRASAPGSALRAQPHEACRRTPAFLGHASRAESSTSSAPSAA